GVCQRPVGGARQSDGFQKVEELIGLDAIEIGYRPGVGMDKIPEKERRRWAALPILSDPFTGILVCHERRRIIARKDDARQSSEFSSHETDQKVADLLVDEG